MLTAREHRRRHAPRGRSRRTFGRASDAPPEIAEALQSGVSRVVGEADARVFLHARAPVVHVILIGATHAGQVLADLARRVGYRVSVVDPRSAFATADRFADVERHAAWPEASLESLGLDAHTAVVALTHVAHRRRGVEPGAALGLLLHRRARLRRTHARRMERLAAAGLDEAALARIHAPVGLAIGAQGPAEIAVSILAEIVKTRRGAWMARIGAVLLAAGASTRFGAGNKLLAELGGRPLVAHAADALLASGVDEIVVVTGRESEQVRQILARTAVRFAHNGLDTRHGVVDRQRSTGAGLAAVRRLRRSGRHAVPHRGTIATLRDQFIRAGGERIVVPTTPEGAQRNPVLWPRRCFAELALLSGAEGGKPLLKRYSDQTVCVAFADALALTDVDTAEDLEAARRQLALRAP